MKDHIHIIPRKSIKIALENAYVASFWSIVYAPVWKQYNISTNNRLFRVENTPKVIHCRLSPVNIIYGQVCAGKSTPVVCPHSLCPVPYSATILKTELRERDRVRTKRLIVSMDKVPELAHSPIDNKYNMGRLLIYSSLRTIFSCCCFFFFCRSCCC